MSITAKELAEKLNLSQTAVSMALNNKPGVSTETRRMVIEAAEKYGYDFTRLSLKKNKAGGNGPSFPETSFSGGDSGRLF